jgi:hypothetical protein
MEFADYIIVMPRHVNPHKENFTIVEMHAATSCTAAAVSVTFAFLNSLFYFIRVQRMSSVFISF